MAPTIVTAALGAILAAALLGPAFDRRSVAIVTAAAVAPDIDAIMSLAVQSGTNAVFHNVWVPLAIGAVLYWDTSVRDDSWLRSRYGWYGIRVAWVSLAAFLVVGIGVDLFGKSGVNLLYPFHDAFYRIDGRFLYSTQRGIVQTYVGWGNGTLGPLAIDNPGTTTTYHVSTWVTPEPDVGLSADVDREVTIVENGWQVVLIVSSVALLAVRFTESWMEERKHNAASGSDGGDR